MNSTNKKKNKIAVQTVILLIALAVLVFIEIGYINTATADQKDDSSNANPVESSAIAPVTPVIGGTTDGTDETVPENETSPEPTAEAFSFEPTSTDATNPDVFISSTTISSGGEIINNYENPEPISFGTDSGYSAVKGITTFKGNNLRNGASYGTTSMTAGQFGTYWTQQTGALTSYSGYTWTGSGWTGQPLIAEWDKDTREIMDMYSWAKEQETLVEVIYATMDGNVYFSELTTGKATRDKLYLGYTFKGAGSLDPRGYPILYVGAGYDGASESPKAMAVSLIDGEILFSIGQGDSFANRPWHVFDSAPLVHAETDKLIWAGENGVIYFVDMNTEYDKSAGTLTVEPDTTKWKYTSKKNDSTGQYWLGMEASILALDNYIIFADNGGHLMCLDVNTLELVWVQDILDDSNCTPVLEIEDGKPYVYISTSFHYGWRSYNTATIPIWKIDATNGEIVWQVDYECYTVADVSGGVQGSVASGTGTLSDLIFVPVARTPNAGGGILTAISKSTGEVAWELETVSYSWSTPVDVYDTNGKGYLIYCNSSGYMMLVDGLSGEIVDEINLGSNIEASPAVYNNTVVVGTRGQVIYGIDLL